MMERTSAVAEPFLRCMLKDGPRSRARLLQYDSGFTEAAVLEARLALGIVELKIEGVLAWAWPEDVDKPLADNPGRLRRRWR